MTCPPVCVLSSPKLELQPTACLFWPSLSYCNVRRVTWGWTDTGAVTAARSPGDGVSPGDGKGRGPRASSCSLCPADTPIGSDRQDAKPVLGESGPVPLFVNNVPPGL